MNGKEPATTKDKKRRQFDERGGHGHACAERVPRILMTQQQVKRTSGKHSRCSSFQYRPRVASVSLRKFEWRRSDDAVCAPEQRAGDSTHDGPKGTRAVGIKSPALATRLPTSASRAPPGDEHRAHQVRQNCCRPARRQPAQAAEDARSHDALNEEKRARSHQSLV